MKEEFKYYIIERDQLGTYGSENGSTKEEAEQLLNDAGRGEDLIIIHGVLIEPKFVLP